MKNHKVSIVIVTYNAKSFIKTAIESVSKQTYTNIELVIIDGNSSDGTVDILKNSNEIAFWLSEPDVGIYDAMNKGIKYATGEWIVFLGADDVFYDSKSISSVFEDEIDCQNFDFIYGNVWLKKSKRIMGGSRDLCSLIENNIPHQAIFYNRRVFDIVGKFNQRYSILGDYDFNIRLFSNPKIKSKYVDKILGIFDQSGVSGKMIDSNFFKDYLAFSQKLARDFNKPILSKKFLFFTGLNYLLYYRFKIGLRYLIKAFSCKQNNFFYLILFAYILIRVALFGKKTVYR